ncbi:MAG: glycosyltransferase family 4 protein [Flavobacteriales bacterium]|nr:glycosyltransferase family 4 protein [Flavobacteriales bacterium]
MQTSKQILIIGKVWPEPTSSAAGTRMVQLIHHFIEKGDKLTFASSANESAHQEDLSKLDISFTSIQLNDHSFNEFIKELNPQVVIFDRFMTEEQFAWRVMEECPSALRILNTEDLHFLREARHTALKRNQSLNLDVLRTELQLRELASIYRSDFSLMVSDFEVNLLHSAYGIPKEKLVHLPIYAQEVYFDQLPFEERADFIFIGNFRHEPNWDAVRYLKSAIWPLIRKKLPKAKLTIYGAYCGEKVHQLTNEREGFLVRGRADDALDVVSKSRVSLAPLRFGAGIKGKLLESMIVGTPSVTSQIGSEGMTDGLWNGFIEDDSKVFAEKAVELYTNKAIWTSAQKNGFELMEQRFSKSAFDEVLKETLDVLSDLETHRNKSLVSLILQRESHQASRYMSIWIEEKKRNGRGGS